jgi:hypothetical protein
MQPRSNIDPLVSELAKLFGGQRAPSAAKLVGIHDRDEISEPEEERRDTAQLEREFHAAMIDLYRRAKRDVGYNATRFLSMVSEMGGLATARLLLRSRDPSEGFLTLVESGRSDLTMEALVANPSYEPLFSEDELALARRRLRDVGI